MDMISGKAKLLVSLMSLLPAQYDAPNLYETEVRETVPGSIAGSVCFTWLSKPQVASFKKLLCCWLPLPDPALLLSCCLIVTFAWQCWSG